MIAKEKGLGLLNLGCKVHSLHGVVKSFPEPQGPILRRWSPFPVALSRTPTEVARPRIRV